MTIQRLKSLHQEASLALKIQMELSRFTQEAKPTLIHEKDNGSTIEEGLNIGKSLFPTELKIMALEQVNLSPRINPGGVAFGGSNSNFIF